MSLKRTNFCEGRVVNRLDSESCVAVLIGGRKGERVRYDCTM